MRPCRDSTGSPLGRSRDGKRDLFADGVGAVADNSSIVLAPDRGGAISLGITFVGHASFVIESAQGVRVLTDYNGYVEPALPPEVVTMNNSHDSHYTDFVDKSIRSLLRGWDPKGGQPFGRPQDNLQGFGFGQSALSPEPRGGRFAVDELHDQEIQAAFSVDVGHAN